MHSVYTSMCFQVREDYERILSEPDADITHLEAEAKTHIIDGVICIISYAVMS